MIGGQYRDTTLKRRLVSGGIQYAVTRTHYSDLPFDTYNTNTLDEKRNKSRVREVQFCVFILLCYTAASHPTFIKTIDMELAR